MANFLDPFTDPQNFNTTVSAPAVIPALVANGRSLTLNNPVGLNLTNIDMTS